MADPCLTSHRKGPPDKRESFVVPKLFTFTLSFCQLRIFIRDSEVAGQARSSGASTKDTTSPS
eukprot:6455255-Amphidinium_carterae.4